MRAYINVLEISGFLFIGLIFIGLNTFLIVRQLVRTRYGIVSIFSASIWPALMIALSVQTTAITFGTITSIRTLEGMLVWAVLVTTGLMIGIPGYSLIRRMLELSK